MRARPLLFCLLVSTVLTTVRPHNTYAANKDDDANAADDGGGGMQQGPPPQSLLGRGLFEFAAALYNKLGKNSGNVVVAPYHTNVVLTLAARGAKGETFNEMAKALGWPTDPNVLKEAQELVAQDVKPPSGTGASWRAANRVWLAKGGEMQPGAWQDEIAAFELGRDKAQANNAKALGDSLNAWAKEETDDHLSKAVYAEAPLTDTKALVGTAMRFAALWELPATAKGKNQDGKASYLSARAKMRFAETPDFKIAELTLSTDHTSLVILIPKSATMNLTKSPDGASLRNLIDNLETTDITIDVPVFHISTHIDLTPGLRALGIETAFGKKAELSGWGQNVQLADMQQALDISVGTDGVDVATATYARFGKAHAKAGKGTKVTKKIARPFLFILRDTYWNVPLLFGRVEGQ